MKSEREREICACAGVAIINSCPPVVNFYGVSWGEHKWRRKKKKVRLMSVAEVVRGTILIIKRTRDSTPRRRSYHFFFFFLTMGISKKLPLFEFSAAIAIQPINIQNLSFTIWFSNLLLEIFADTFNEQLQSSKQGGFRSALPLYLARFIKERFYCREKKFCGSCKVSFFARKVIKRQKLLWCNF